MSATDCTKCDGWGCRGCMELGGEQSPSVSEQREARLMGRIATLEALILEQESVAADTISQGEVFRCPWCHACVLERWAGEDSVSAVIVHRPDCRAFSAPGVVR